MAYTPQLSQKSCATLRRIAWSYNKPMTKTLDWILTDLVKIIPPEAICEACKDPRCDECVFSNQGKPCRISLKRKDVVNVE